MGCSEYVTILVSVDLESKSGEFIFERIFKIEDYSDWWHLPVTVIDFDNRILKFTPIPFIEIFWKQRYDASSKEIICDYIKGPLVGFGIWQISVDNNSNKMSISYEIKVKGINMIFDMLLRTFIFKYKHSKDILRIIQKASESNTIV